jgi:hypothetical protein
VEGITYLRCRRTVRAGLSCGCHAAIQCDRRWRCWGFVWLVGMWIWRTQNLEFSPFDKRERFQAAADTQVHLRPHGARSPDNGVQGNAAISLASKTMAIPVNGIVDAFFPSLATPFRLVGLLVKTMPRVMSSPRLQHPRAPQLGGRQRDRITSLTSSVSGILCLAPRIVKVHSLAAHH